MPSLIIETHCKLNIICFIKVIYHFPFQLGFINVGKSIFLKIIVSVVFLKEAITMIRKIRGIVIVLTDAIQFLQKQKP